MRILIAGSSGLIGSNVARILHVPDHTIFRVDIRPGTGIEDSYNLRNPFHCEEAVANMERVFHLADRTAGIGYSSAHHGEMMTNSLLISLNLLEAARQAGVKDYVYVSSSCVYPNRVHIHEDPAAESAVFFERWGDLGGLETSNEGYGWAKRIAERQCVYYAKEYGMRTIIARPANVYGPSYNWRQPIEDMHVIPALICKMLRGDSKIVVWGSGDQTRTFQYEADTAKLLVELADRGAPGEAYNLGGIEQSIRGIAEQLQILCDYHGEMIYDLSKPEGPLRKAYDCSKLRALIPETEEPIWWLSATVEAARKAMESVL